MSDGSKIEWTDATVNAINGCSLASPGCTNCYAMRLAGTRMKNHPTRKGLTIDTKAGPVWNGEVRLVESALLQPLRWQRSRTIFWNAHGDLFHPNVPDEWVDRQFAVMALTPQHKHLVLTKRADRQRAYINAMWEDDAAHLRRMTEAVNWVFRKSGLNWGRCHSTSSYITTAARDGATGAREPSMLRGTGDGGAERLVQWTDEGEKWSRVSDEFAARLPAYMKRTGEFGWGLKQWPLPNLWLGVSVEDQARADERILHLLNTYAEGRFLSCEPLLGPINLNSIMTVNRETQGGGWETGWESCLNGKRFNMWAGDDEDPMQPGFPKIDGVIVGGESGTGARPMHPDWARSIRDQCAAAGTDFHFKQWGNFSPLRVALPVDGEGIGAVAWPDGTVGGGNAASKGGAGQQMYCSTKAIAGRELDGQLHDALPWTRKP